MSNNWIDLSVAVADLVWFGLKVPLLLNMSTNIMKIMTTTLLIGGFFVAGCTQPNQNIHVTPKVANYLKAEQVVRKYTGDGVCMTCFNSYRTRKFNKAFAMSEQGAFGIANGHDTIQKAKRSALSSCRSNEKKNPSQCRLLMVNDKYVW